MLFLLVFPLSFLHLQLCLRPVLIHIVPFLVLFSQFGVIYSSTYLPGSIYLHFICQKYGERPSQHLLIFSRRVQSLPSLKPFLESSHQWWTHQPPSGLCALFHVFIGTSWLLDFVYLSFPPLDFRLFESRVQSFPIFVFPGV